MSNPHLCALLEALVVTFLWSTSFVLINVGLQDMPALTFAGLCYTLGFLCLLPFFLRSADLSTVRNLRAAGWGRLIALGLIFYAITQGGIFLALTCLRSVTVSLFLSFTPALVALLGVFLLRERPAHSNGAALGFSFPGHWHTSIHYGWTIVRPSALPFSRSACLPTPAPLSSAVMSTGNDISRRCPSP